MQVRAVMRFFGKGSGSAESEQGGRAGVSIRARLAWLIVLVALPISAERVFALLAERQRQVAATIAHLRDVARAVDLIQRENIATARAVSETIVHQASALMADPDTCSQVLRKISGNLVAIQGIAIAEPPGLIRCTTSRALLGLDVSDRAYVQEALRAPRPVLSDFILSRNTARNILVVAEAERNAAGDPVALVLVGLDLEWVSQLAGQVAAAAQVTVLVLDGQGAALARHPARGDLVGRPLPDHPVTREALKADEGSFEAEGLDGVRRYYVFVRMPDSAVRILVGVDRAEALGAIDRRIFSVLAVLLGSVGILICCALYIADRMIVAPVQQLARDILAVGREEVQQIRDVGFREFRPIIGAINEMSRRIGQRATDLRNLNHRLAALASMDGLTGLANRRTFDVQFSGEWVQSADAGRSLALVLLDIDNFKLFNDTMGHLAGDEALRGVARMLAVSAAGSGNLAARYGGEEFVVLLPNTDLSGAVDFAEDVRRLIAALAINHPKVPEGRLTASLGVAAAVPGPDNSPDTLLAAADAALYEAKRLGRNRVVGARDLGEMANA